MDGIKRKSETRNSVWFYIAGFLIGGALHLADRFTVMAVNGGKPSDTAVLALISTVLFTLNLSVYFLVIVRWFVSVRTRLLPSRGRAYLSIAAIMMAAFLLDRAVKYRVAAEGSLLQHAAWYGYYVPLAIIPTMFILTCLSAEPESRRKKIARAAAAAVCAVLVLAVVSNDFHLLMFRPIGDAEQSGQWGTYTTGPVWYVYYAFIILCVIAGAVLLAVRDRREKRGRRTLPSVLILFLMLVTMTVFDRFVHNSPWAFPEIAVFSMLGIFESCVRSRLIPSNENYERFFENVSFPALITDRDLAPVFRTASGGAIPTERLSDAAGSPYELGDGRVLCGRELSSGYVFFVSDESGIRALNDKLADVMDALEGENELLRLENQQKEERARIDARNAVYARASSEVYDVQKRISVYLRRAEDGGDYKANVAKALLLNAYVKRTTNFVLISSERDEFSAEELFSALSESARFLALCGVGTSVERETDWTFSYAEVRALYDTFEMLIEALPEDAKALSVALGDGSIRLLCDSGPFHIPGGTPAAVETLTEDGQLYLSVTVREGGAG